MKREKSYNAKQVGERIRARRTELNLSMSQLGERLGVNKSTIQRYETNGIEPKRNYVIFSMAEALETTPEWLLGKTEDREQDGYTKSRKLLNHAETVYLYLLTKEVESDPQQEQLTRFLCDIIHLYLEYCQCFEIARAEAEQMQADDNLNESLRKYAIDADAITSQIFHRELAEPVEHLKQYIDLLMDANNSESAEWKADVMRIKNEAAAKRKQRKNPVAP